MEIDFEPISSVGDLSEALAIAELCTLFSGSYSISDLTWDDEQFLRSFVETIDDPEEKAYFTEEVSVGLSFAREQFISALQELIHERHSSLGASSPFTWDFEAGILLNRKPPDETNFASLAYLWLSLFSMVSSEKDYLKISKGDAEYIRHQFESVFELICCLALSGRGTNAVWYLGDSRSVKFFLNRLERIAKLCGYGSVKPLGDIEAHQTGANDAGVDVAAIELRNGIVQIDSEGYLLGATIQKKDRRKKVIGPAERKRFTDYFQLAPRLTYRGVLAIPFHERLDESLVCRDNDCIYLPKNEIIRYLGNQPKEANLFKYIIGPSVKLRRASKSLQEKLSLAGPEGSLPLLWV